MKKTSEGRNNDEPRTEYRIDYTKSKPNRFAERTRRQGVAVLLDPVVARVNKALRALIKVVPGSAKPQLYSPAVRICPVA
jgi:hypothetical protein